MADKHLKITVDQLKNYLGTGLKCEIKVYDDELFTDILYSISDGQASFKSDFNEWYMFEYFKPICFRLSDLDKFIQELGFVPLERLCDFTTTELNGNGEIESAEYDCDCHVTKMPDSMYWYRMQLLFQCHFWPFGDEYFEKGLVIDKIKKQGNGR